MTLPWCPGCGRSRACDQCIRDDVRAGRREPVVTVTYCTCTPLAPQAHHEPGCPAHAAAAQGLDVLPPALWREVVRPTWERGEDGRWARTGEERYLVPVVALAPCVVVVLDTETTGLSERDRVCELAMARVDLSTGGVIEEREQLVSPGLPNGARHINGISDAMLRGQPRLVDLWPAARAWIGADPVLAHNAPFDRKMLARECPDADDLAWTDTKAWAKRVYPSQVSHGLPALAAALKLPTGTAHRALGDVRTLCALATRLYGVSGEMPQPAVRGPASSASRASSVSRARNLFGVST